jgi:hypothetical protein
MRSVLVDGLIRHLNECSAAINFGISADPINPAAPVTSTFIAYAMLWWGESSQPTLIRTISFIVPRLVTIDSVQYGTRTSSDGRICA